MRPRSDTRLVWTGARCSYGCGACPIDAGASPPGVRLPDLLHALAAVPPSAGALAVLVGGEPLLRSDCMRLLAAIRTAGWAPGLVTTGRPLLYPSVRERLRRAGLAYLRVQLFGVGEAHDRATAVPGAFAQALDGLRAWTADGLAECDVDVALTVRKRSAIGLAAEVEALAALLPSPDVQIVIAIDASDGDPREAQQLHAAAAALAAWSEIPGRPLLVWEGHDGAAPVTSRLAPSLPRQFVSVAPRACCLGAVADGAAARSGRDAETCANSFNFVRTDTSVPRSADAESCTAHAAADGSAVERQIWLVEGDRLILHLSDTHDFAPSAIAQVKDVNSHVFVDCAPPGVLDDFTEGMRRVLPDAICDGCAHRARCGRRFQRVDGSPYAREEAWIADYVSRLRGRVLDVGCGEQLYRAEIAPRIQSGAVQYTGIDPDDVSLASARAALPGGRFLAGGIEDFCGEPASYDHILCLRSLNHVDDVDEALARMAALLKPGGSLLVVECTPFAMLRSRAQVTAADRAPRAGHQHYRNLASEEVVPFARRRSLRVLEHQPASLATTNEWILLLGRARPG